jgi:hypothetical protein
MISFIVEAPFSSTVGPLNPDPRAVPRLLPVELVIARARLSLPDGTGGNANVGKLINN